MNDKTLNACLVQHACSTDRDENLARSEAGIREAAAAGADLVLLPELHAGEYFCRSEDPAMFDLAEPIDGVSAARLRALAAELGLVIVGSIFERRAAGIYHNTALVFDGARGLAGIYRKMHIPEDPGYHEKFYFTPGDLGFHPIDTSIGRLGVLVCWDQWYPEAARLMALAGAQILLYPTAIGWDPDDSREEQQRQRDAWTMIQRSHAVANHLPVLACNRHGIESQQIFWGSSFICGPQGEILAQANADPDQVISAGLDLTRSERLRRMWPFFRDRRIDEYAGLLKRFNA